MIKIGNANIPQIKIGETQIKKVCCGEDIVWKKVNIFRGETINPNTTFDIRINKDEIATITSGDDCKWAYEYDGDITSIYRIFAPYWNIAYENTHKVIDMTFVDLSKLTKGEDASQGAFSKMKSVQTIILNGDVLLATNSGSIFQNCTGLKNIDGNYYFRRKDQTPKLLGYWDAMYDSCGSLEIIDLSGITDFNPQNTINIFRACRSLSTIYPPQRIYSGFDISYSPITLQSAIAVLNSLQEVQTEQTITFSSHTSALIMADDNAMEKVVEIADLGWNVTLN